MTITEIQRTLSEAHQQAAAIAQKHDSGDIRILAIAIAETARAARALAGELN
ncbi:MAG: hypothetical protein JWP75_3527 [Frondihabitans sp.]|nr:hypothetical protein [Frondihabitans sp.]